MSDASALTGAFVAHLGAAAARVRPSATLEEQLRERCAAAAAAWPGVTVPAVVFVEHVAERLADEEDPEKALAQVNIGDLYLTCACLRGAAGAVEAFNRAVLSRVPSFIGRIDTSPAFADEVCQVLRERLLLGAAGASPRIGDYAGRGALLKWVRVAAVRTALNLNQQRERQFGEGKRLAAAPLPAAYKDPELAYMKDRHRLDFQEAFQAALGELSSEQRNLLRLRFVDELSIDQIAQLFQVHRTTIVRKLAAARQEVQGQTRQLLKERLRLSSSEFDQLAGLVRSQIEVQLSDLLKASLVEPG